MSWNIQNNFGDMMMMMKLLTIFLLLVIPALSFSSAFAEDFDIFVTSTQNSPSCQVDNSCWSDDSITINQGDTITWHNDVDYDISIVSGDISNDIIGKDFDSGIILSGSEYSFMFDIAGQFEYFSAIQPWMIGTVTVIADPNAEPTCGPGTVPSNGICVVMSDTPTCGPGTIPLDGVCIADPGMIDDDTVNNSTINDDMNNNMLGDTPTCGPGTMSVDGVCKVIDDNAPTDGGGCLIATAAYGTELAPQVQLLREIRDNVVMGTASGQSFMSGFNQLYYAFSPSIADLQREHLLFNDTIRVLITPMILSLGIMDNAESESEVLFYGMITLAVNAVMYAGIPIGATFLVSKMTRRIRV